MCVFARFEGEAVEVDGEEVEEVFVDEAGDETVDLLRGAFSFCCNIISKYLLIVFRIALPCVPCRMVFI